MKKVLKFIGWIALILLSLVAILLVIVVLKSPGKADPYQLSDGTTPERSLSEIVSLKVGDTPQSLIIKSKDSLNPVLLYVHGGPGSPEFFFIEHFGSQIDQRFTVCYWEQLGAGKSYYPNIDPALMSLDQFVDDGAAVSTYLKKRFGKEKIFLMGHSWGSMLGSYMAARYPDHFYAYFGIGQVANQLLAEQISYDWVLETAKQKGDEKGIAQLTEIGCPPYGSIDETLTKLLIERKFVAKYGGSIHKGIFYKEASIAILNSREYTLKDKINFFRGMTFSLSNLWGEVMDRNLFDEIPTQTIPVYIFQGIHDYQTAYPVAKAYFDSLQAPHKEFHSFAYSAHSPNFEEPTLMDSLLNDILIRDFSQTLSLEFE